MKEGKPDKKISRYFSVIFCFFSLFRKKSYIFTLLFFSIILGLSVFFWWTCVYPLEPNPQLRIEFYQGRENFDQMSRKIGGVIQELQKKEQNFHNPPNLEGQRDLFKSNNNLFLRSSNDPKEQEPKNLQ